LRPRIGAKEILRPKRRHSEQFWCPNGALAGTSLATAVGMCPTLPKLGLLAGMAVVITTAGSSAESVEPRPDLVIQSLELSHDRLAPDTVVVAKLAVANRGAAGAPAFRVAIYHSDGLVVPQRGNVTRIGTVVVRGGLAPGKWETHSLPVRIPPCDRCLPGSIYAYADAWGTVLEASEENNFKAVPVSVDRAYLPNLSMEDIGLSPDRGALERSVTLRATLRNAAPFVAQGPIKLGVYCSGDFELDRSDLALASWIVPAVPANGVLRLERNLRVDTRCAVHGQHVQIGVLADVDGYVTESDELDNGRLAPFWVFRAPDLTPGEVAVFPRGGPPRAPALASFAVKNDGKVAAGPFKVGVYWSKDARITTEDRLIDTIEVPSLAAGKSTGALHQELAVPDLPSGDYYVGVVVDVDRSNGELREHNNMKAAPFQLRRINVSDRFFFVDKSAARAGDEIDLEFALRNTGPDAAPAFEVGFYYSEDPRFDASDIRIGSFALKRLAGTEAKAHHLGARLPASAHDGYRFILMVTDDGDAVNEMDERDNVALRALLVGREVRPGGGPRP